VLLFGHGKKTHLFATNKKLAPHLIKINAHTKNKIKTPNHLIIQPNQPSSRHLPPPTARLRRADAAATALSGDFPARKKKKKKIRPLGVAAIHPYGQGREIRPPLVALFVFGEPKKKIRQTQKKIWPTYKIVSNASKIDSNATKLVSNASKLKPRRKS
jgi:hypothetical protein